MQKFIEENRDKSIDIFKGLLILFVVLGHYPYINITLKNIIYWFHMPLFFLTSGYLFKFRKESQKIILNKLLKKYFIPYIIYFIIISLFLEKNFYIKNILRFLYGGRMYHGVYWFIPCLVITILAFNFIISKFSKKMSIIIITVMGILSSFESLFYIPNNKIYSSWSLIYKMPLNIDVCLLSIVYFMIGYYYKDKINLIKGKVNKFVFIICLIIFLTLINLYISGKFNFYFDMKYSHYRNFLLNIMIPLLVGYLLLTFSFIIKESYIGSILRIIGNYTIPIMYLHIPLNTYVSDLFKYRIYIYIYLLIGILIPLMFGHICSKFIYLDRIFNGNVKNNINSKSKPLTCLCQERSGVRRVSCDDERKPAQ